MRRPRAVRGLGGKFLSLFLNWFTRGLAVVGGVIAVLLGWPITEAAWQATRADATLYALRTLKRVDTREATTSLEALNRAVALDPVAGRYLVRSELLGTAPLIPTVTLDAAQRDDWLRRARADLVTGLANAPARGIDWLRLAALDQQLDGPSRRVVALLFASIDLAGGIPQAWPVQLRLILDGWTFFTDGDKERLKRHVEMIWRHSALDRRLFANATGSAADHAILTWFLRDVPDAPQELARVIEKETKFIEQEKASRIEQEKRRVEEERSRLEQERNRILEREKIRR
ncbi:MAG TPA: hypothetical protein VEC60_02820 [Reyranella sp.]|nr:hypothetical protein [Reyranella sp.]